MGRASVEVLIITNKNRRKEKLIMLNKILLNSTRFLNSIKASCGVIFGIISAILLFVDKEKLGITTLKTGIIVLGGSLLLALIYAVIRVMFYTKVEAVKGKVVLKYDDLWNISFCKRGKKKIVVVGVNTTFDTVVDEEVQQQYMVSGLNR